MAERIFKESEMKLLKPKQSIDLEELLQAEGLYFFKDVAKILGLTAQVLSKHMKASGLDEQTFWERYGVRKLWTHWIIHMERFAPLYRAKLKPLYKQVPKGWDGNRLLTQSGIYLLIQVCKVIPFTTHQLRYQARKYSDSRAAIGVWKDPKSGMYLVDMNIFSPWVQKIWKEGAFHGSTQAAGTKPEKTSGTRPKKPRPDKRAARHARRVPEHPTENGD